MANNENAAAQQPAELKRVLTLRSLIFYGMAFMIPLAFFTTIGIVEDQTHGMVAMAYLIATVGMVFTAYSYCKMSKAYPKSGSTYAYAQGAFNPYVGFMAGWTIVLGYMFLPMLNYLASAIYLESAFPQIPMWIWIVLFIVIVTVINLIGISVADIFNNIVIWLQVIFLVVLAFMVIKYIVSGGDSGDIAFNFKAFFNSEEFAKDGVGIPALAAGAGTVCLAFLGFDGIATLGEETINPEKNIPRGIMITCVGAGILFMFFTYLMQVAEPDAVTKYADNLDGMAFDLIAGLAGNVMGYLFTAGYVIGCIAASISAVASASRVLYNMGRDGLLPKKIFGYISPKSQVPSINILIMGLFGLTAFFFSLTIAAHLINFGALVGFTIVNITVIKHYYIDQKERGGGGFFKYFLIPAIGAIYVVYMALNLSGVSLLYGLAWEVVGFIYLAVTTAGFKKLPKEMELD